MQFQNEEELARYLGAAFTAYANKVQNGLTGPYKKFMSGESTVNVKIRVDTAGVTVEEIADASIVEPPKVVVSTLKRPIEESAKAKRKFDIE